MKFGLVLYYAHSDDVEAVTYCGKVDAFSKHTVLRMNGFTTVVDIWQIHKTRKLAEKYYEEKIKPAIVAHHGRELRKY